MQSPGRARRATRHWQLTSAPGRAIGLQTIYRPLNLISFPKSNPVSLRWVKQLIQTSL
jgi:hypothetical protein